MSSDLEFKILMKRKNDALLISCSTLFTYLWF